MRDQREANIALRTDAIDELPPFEIDTDLIRETRER